MRDIKSAGTAENVDPGALFDFSRLRRSPDVEAPNLFAFDATDKLILTEAAGALAVRSDGPAEADGEQIVPDGGMRAPYAGSTVAVVGDRYGALTLPVVSTGGGNVRVHQDLMAGERALDRNAAELGLSGRFRRFPLGKELFDGVSVVLWQLPKSMAELAETADQIARYARPDVRIFAGGRIKHMTMAMNALLQDSFGEVHAGLARQKSRVLTAAEPIRPTEEPAFPARQYHQELGLWVCAYGATFAGPRLDIGTRYLLEFIDRMKPDAQHAVDLGCGSGVISAVLANARPQITVTATDQSAAAVASAAATAEANGLSHRICTVQDDAMAGFPTGSAELILLNPPFHLGTTVHAGAAVRLFDAAARVLAPGGELWTVYNNHLHYRTQLQERIGPTTVQARNQKFTVALSSRS
ncbi:methyltransferase [Paeniglutamicibacter antarcticus]|uniref:Methyltransferase n=1 Tax=Arthrobacter terrae TaxID=2935737 RepID=A0A931CR16_9MICC|nr:methyltransferase [Arthrobacter terrae]MBG0740970.1 methyltransferase [Arthrobacter terrae]